MKWKPEDMEKPDLLECGKTYDAKVVEAREKVSQKGNDYINLRLAVYASPDKTVTQFTVIMPQWPDKFKSFLLSAGMYQQLAAQEITAADCEGKNCRVMIGDKKNDDGFVEIVSFEIPADAAEKMKAAKSEQASAPKVALDDLPF